MNRHIGEEFLSLCNLESEYFLPLLERSCIRWNISEEELTTAVKKYIPTYYRVELNGIRKLLGLYVEEWLRFEELKNEDSVKIYFNVPGSVSGMLWLKESIQKNVYLGTPDLICMVVLYGVLGIKQKLENNSCRHCAVNLMRYHLSKDHMIPKPNIRWSWGLLCDEAPKMDEMIRISEQASKNIIISKPAKVGEKEVYLKEQILEAFYDIKQDYLLKLNSEVYRRIKKERFLLSAKIEQIMRIMNKKERFIISNADISLIETLLLAAFRCDQKDIIQILGELINEINIAETKEFYKKLNRIEKKYAIYYTPVCNPEYSRIFEENEIALLFYTAFKSRAVYTGKKDCYEDIVLECTQMLIGETAQEEGIQISNLILEQHLDGLILGMFSFDRWLGAHQNLLKKIVEKRTEKNVFIYETDFWNQESFTQDRMKTSIETLKKIGVMEWL